MHGLPLTTRVPVLDEAIESTRYTSRDAERFLAVSELDEGHPALKSVERFEGVKFYQAVHVTPTKSRVLAKLGDQTRHRPLRHHLRLVRPHPF